jgi:hypothetical protein
MTTLMIMSCATADDIRRQYVSTILVTLEVHMRDGTEQDAVLETTVTLQVDVDRNMPTLRGSLTEAFGKPAKSSVDMFHGTYTYQLTTHPQDVVRAVRYRVPLGPGDRMSMPNPDVREAIRGELDDFAHAPHVLMTALSHMEHNRRTSKRFERMTPSERILYLTSLTSKVRRGGLSTKSIVGVTYDTTSYVQDAVAYLAQHPQLRLAWAP